MFKNHCIRALYSMFLQSGCWFEQIPNLLRYIGHAGDRLECILSRYLQKVSTNKFRKQFATHRPRPLLKPSWSPRSTTRMDIHMIWKAARAVYTKSQMNGMLNRLSNDLAIVFYAAYGDSESCNRNKLLHIMQPKGGHMGSCDILTSVTG